MAGYIDIGISPITNDLFGVDGKVGIVKGSDEVVQRVKTRLRRILGEWFLDINAGLPYFNGDMLGGKDTKYVLMIVKAEILDTEGVQEVTSISINYNHDTRKSTVAAKIIVNDIPYSITEEI